MVGMVTWPPIKIDYNWSEKNVKKFHTKNLPVFIKSTFSYSYQRGSVSQKKKKNHRSFFTCSKSHHSEFWYTVRGP